MKTLQKIFNLLTNKQKKQIVVLIFLMLLGMVFETLGVGLILPILVLLVEPNLIEKYPFVEPLLRVLDHPSREVLIVYAMLCLIVIYSLKFMYLVFLNWRQYLFTSNVKIKQSNALFSLYLNQPYTFHLQKNSAELIRNVNGNIGHFNRGLISSINLIAEILIISGIMLLILIIEPLGSMIALVFLLCVGGVFFGFTKNKLTKLGEIVRFHSGLRLKFLQEGLGGIKSIQLFGKQDFFLNQFSAENSATENAVRKQSIINVLPRLWFEFVIILAMAGFVMIMVLKQSLPAQIVPILGLFVVSAMRILPSISRLTIALQNLRYVDPAVEKLSNEIHKFNQNTNNRSEKSDGNTSQGIDLSWQKIHVRGVNFYYPDTDMPSLHNVNMEITRNSSIGIIGVSGAGKSTIIDMILGLLIPSQGEVLLDEKKISDELRDWQNQIGYVPQNIYLTDDSLRNNIAFGLKPDEIDEQSIQLALKKAQLDSYVSSLKSGLDTRVGEQGVRLSGGQKQRIGIARALYNNPTVLVLDEASSALDVETEAEVMKAVNALRGQQTILTISHRIISLKDCDWIYKLENGRVVDEGVYSDVISD